MGLKKVFSDDFNTQRLQDNVSDAIRAIENAIIVNGVVVTGIAVVSGSDIQVNHGLNRNPVGFLMIDSNAQVTVWQSTTVNNFKNKMLLLRASATATINLYIF
jgi:hypothetical protein